jgi:hypothetical protein
MMKRILASLILLGCTIFPGVVHSQTVTITSTNLGDSARNLYSGVVMFQPTLSSGIPTSYRMGGGGATTSAMIQTIATRGVFSISVPDVTLTFPAPICLKLIAPGITTGYNCLQPHATSTSSSDWCQSGVCNLDNYPPNIAPQVTVQTGPAGPAGPAGPNSVSTSTGSTISGLLKGAAGKVAQAVAGIDYALPGGGGLPAGMTTNKLQKATSASAIGDSAISDDGTTVTSTEPLVAPSFSTSGNGGTLLTTTPVPVAFLPGNGSCTTTTATANHMPTCTPATGMQATISNAASTCDATVGSGTTVTWVFYNGSAWAPSNPICALTLPTGTIVGTTDTQTLTNKTVDGVSPTTMAYMDATSSVQAQLNGKQATLTNPVVTIFSGTWALGTSAIASGAYASTITVTATGVLASDNVDKDWASDPTSVTGYAGTTSGALTVYVFPGSGVITIKVYNGTSASITPSAMTLILRVRR